MIRNKLCNSVLFIIVFLFIQANPLNAQTFGFGCLGLSGFYGGYTQQRYVADGINEFVKLNYSGINRASDFEFKEGTGFRVGANIFRAKFSSLFISAKGFFQFLRENHELTEEVQNGTLKNKYQLSMNHWGVALDFGVPLFAIIDWKIVEGGVTFYYSEFVYQIFLNNNQQSELKIAPDKLKIGYYIGSGLIFHIIPDYISIEGTAGYTFLRIDKMQDDSGVIYPLASNKNMIEKGSFSATVQLNVGFPF